MPWCEECAKFWNPASMRPGGECPSCGRGIAAVEDEDDRVQPKAPWHFKLLMAALVIYLGYRAVQAVMWLIAHH